MQLAGNRKISLSPYSVPVTTFAVRSQLTGLGWAVVAGTLLLTVVGFVLLVYWTCHLWCAALDGL